MRYRPLILALGDAAAIVVFAVLGLLNHEEGVTVDGILRNAGPIILGYFATALVFRAFTRPAIGRVLLAWLLGVPVGVVIRALILHRHFGRTFFTFLGVTMGVALVLLLAWRAIAAVLVRAETSSALREERD
jgi:hypothetical protein